MKQEEFSHSQSLKILFLQLFFAFMLFLFGGFVIVNYSGQMIMFGVLIKTNMEIEFMLENILIMIILKDLVLVFTDTFQLNKIMVQ